MGGALAEPCRLGVQATRAIDASVGEPGAERRGRAHQSRIVSNHIACGKPYTRAKYDKNEYTGIMNRRRRMYLCGRRQKKRTGEALLRRDVTGATCLPATGPLQ